jgi:hypothetical protein
VPSAAAVAPGAGQFQFAERVGGLIHEYDRAA